MDHKYIVGYLQWGGHTQLSPFQNPLTTPDTGELHVYTYFQLTVNDILKTWLMSTNVVCGWAVGDTGDCADLAISPVCVRLAPGLTGVLSLEPFDRVLEGSTSIGILSSYNTR